MQVVQFEFAISQDTTWKLFILESIVCRRIPLHNPR